MENSLHNRNKKAKEQKTKRQQALLRLLDKHDFDDQEEIIEALKKNQGIRVSQPTLSRDMNELGITKNQEGFYKPSQVAQKEFQFSLLKELLVSSNAAICTNVATYFIRTEEGKAQEIAYHLRKTFDDSILATNVGLDYIILFVDADNPPEELLELFED